MGRKAFRPPTPLRRPSDLIIQEVAAIASPKHPFAQRPMLGHAEDPAAPLHIRPFSGQHPDARGRKSGRAVVNMGVHYRQRRAARQADRDHGRNAPRIKHSVGKTRHRPCLSTDEGRTYRP